MNAVARGAVAALVVALAVTPPTAWAQEQAATQGQVVYDRWCAGCHGDEGQGDGPAAAYMLPRPRDFTTGTYQIKTTPAGELASDADILRIIDEGMPGTAMPGWRSTLTNQQRQALVEHLKGFSQFFAAEAASDPLPIGRPPGVTDEGLEEGRAVYDQLECWRCHGQQGRGDGPSAFEQADDAGFPIRTADLTMNWRFTGGGRVEDIYLRMMTGVEGTPMPSQADAVASGVVTEEQLWRVAQYVRSLSPEEPPRVREVVRAALVEGALPDSPDDEAWSAADEFFFPLVGQIITSPRWFAPSVAGVWVRALHNGEELSLRLRWHDPSRSPDAVWQEWQAGILGSMASDEAASSEPQALPDAFAVQFPRTIPEGMDRPYFLMGDGRDPVYLWHWDSVGDQVTEATARGLGQIEALPPDQQQIVAASDWQEGEWTLVVQRALVAEESDRLSFTGGQPIPIAFYAWDGDNAESGTRGAISTWYFIHLDEPGSNSVFIVPITATLLTFALGLAFVVRAQRRPHGGDVSK